MDFQFYQVDEILNYNVHNIEYTKEKRVFKSRRLGKGNYKLRSSRKLFDDICYFFNTRAEDCKNIHEGYVNNNFMVKLDFLPFLDSGGNCVDFQVFTVKYNENGLRSFLTDEKFFNEQFFINMENKFCYNIYVTDILKYETPQDDTEDESYYDEPELDDEPEEPEEEPEEEIPKINIGSILKINDCCVCFENTSDLLYLPCKHVHSCNECDEKGKFKKCPICRTKINLKIKI